MLARLGAWNRVGSISMSARRHCAMRLVKLELPASSQKPAPANTAVRARRATEEWGGLVRSWASIPVRGRCLALWGLPPDCWVLAVLAHGALGRWAATAVRGFMAK